MGLTWTFNGDQQELAILQLNLVSKSCDGWHLQENAIKILREKYDGIVLSIFDEAVSLIPKDAFYTPTSSSSTFTSITTSSGVFLPEFGTKIEYGDEQKEASTQKCSPTKQTNVENPPLLLIEGINNLKRLHFQISILDDERDEENDDIPGRSFRPPETTIKRLKSCRKRPPFHTVLEP
jgi:hypothetical protein